MSGRRSKAKREKNLKIHATKKTADIEADEVSCARRKTRSKNCHDAGIVEDTLHTPIEVKVPETTTSATNLNGKTPILRKLRSHNSGNEKDKKRCKICFLQFANTSNLRRHMRRFAKPSYPCDKCGTKFSDLNQLEIHVKNAHNIIKVETSNLNCPFCDQIIYPPRHLQSHVYHFHNGGSPKVKKKKKKKRVVAVDEKTGKKKKLFDGKRKNRKILKVEHPEVESSPTTSKSFTEELTQCAATVRKILEDDGGEKIFNSVEKSENSRSNESLETTEPQGSREDENDMKLRECDSRKFRIHPETAKNQDIREQDRVNDKYEHPFAEQSAAGHQEGEIKVEGSCEIQENHETVARVDNRAAIDDDIDDHSQPKVCKLSVSELEVRREISLEDTLQNIPEKFVQEETETGNLIEDNNAEISRNDQGTKETLVENTEQENAVDQFEKSINRVENNSNDFVNHAELDQDEVSLYSRCMKKDIEGSFVDNKDEKDESQRILKNDEKSDKHEHSFAEQSAVEDQEEEIKIEGSCEIQENHETVARIDSRAVIDDDIDDHSQPKVCKLSVSELEVRREISLEDTLQNTPEKFVQEETETENLIEDNNAEISRIDQETKKIFVENTEQKNAVDQFEKSINRVENNSNDFVNHAELDQDEVSLYSRCMKKDIEGSFVDNKDEKDESQRNLKNDEKSDKHEHSFAEQSAAEDQEGEIKIEGSCEIQENHETVARIDNRAAIDDDIDDHSQPKVCKLSVSEIEVRREISLEDTLQNMPEKFVQEETETGNLIEDNNAEISRNDLGTKETLVENTEQENAVDQFGKSINRVENNSNDFVTHAELDQDEVSLYSRCMKKDIEGSLVDNKDEKDESRRILKNDEKSDVIDDEKEKSMEIFKDAEQLENLDHDQSVASTISDASGKNYETKKSLEVLENVAEKTELQNGQSLASTRFNNCGENDETAQSPRVLQNGEENEESESDRVIDSTILNFPEEISENQKFIEIAENRGKCDTSDNLLVNDDANFNATTKKYENTESRKVLQNGEVSDETDNDRVTHCVLLNAPEENFATEKSFECSQNGDESVKLDDTQVENKSLDGVENGEAIDETAEDRSTNETSLNEPEENHESEEMLGICQVPTKSQIGAPENIIIEKSLGIMGDGESIDKIASISTIEEDGESIDKIASISTIKEDEEDYSKSPINSNLFTINETTDISKKLRGRPKRRSRRQSTNKNINRSMPIMVKVNRLKKNKIFKNTDKQSASKLHAVLAEVAAIFSTMNELPEENYDLMKLPEVKKIEGVSNNIVADYKLEKLNKSVINDNEENFDPRTNKCYLSEICDEPDNISQENCNNQPEKLIVNETISANLEMAETPDVDLDNRVNDVNENSMETIDNVLDEVEALLSDENINIFAEDDENCNETPENVETNTETGIRQLNNENVLKENSESEKTSEIPENCVKINNNNETKITGYKEKVKQFESKISSIRESIREFDNTQIIKEMDRKRREKNSEISKRCKETTNSDNTRVTNETNVNGSEENSKNNESKILHNCKTSVQVLEENSTNYISAENENIDNTKVICETITKLHEESSEKEESKISKNGELIDYPKRLSDPKIINETNVGVHEENSENHRSEIPQNCKKIDNSKFVDPTNRKISEESLKECESTIFKNTNIYNLSEDQIIEKTCIVSEISNSKVINDTHSAELHQTRIINEAKISKKNEKLSIFDQPIKSVAYNNHHNKSSYTIVKNRDTAEIIDKGGVDISQKPSKYENAKNPNNIINDHPSVKTRKPKIFEKLYEKLQLFINAEKSDDSDVSDASSYETYQIDKYLGKRGAFECDDDLRKYYDCKHCYVSITRLKNDRWNSSIDEYEKISDKSDIPSPAFWCIYCCVAFSSKEKRQCHMDDRHTMISSRICNKIFTTMSSMRRHCRERHEVGCDENETCICGKHMHSRETLDNHFYENCKVTRTVEKLPPMRHDDCSPLPKLNACPTCDRDFWLKSCLDIHRLDCKRTVVRTCPRPELPRLVPMRKEVIGRKFGQGPIIDPNERVCRICHTEFVSSIGLLKHEVTYARDEHLSCGYCGTIFCRNSLLKAHVKATHTAGVETNYLFHCAICNQGFSKRIHRHIHMTHIHGEKYQEIATSNRQIESSNDQMTFQDVPSIPGNSAYCDAWERDKVDDLPGGQCPICELVFTSRKRFIDHVIYYKNDEIISCPLCKIDFEGQHAAHRHNKLVHYNDEMTNAYPHRCYMCKEGFVYRRHLKAHFSHVHDKTADEILLAECESNGVEARRTIRDDPGFCIICETSFGSVEQLLAHQMDQQNDGKFVCARCSKKCRTAIDLLDHLSLNHSSTGHDSVQCRRCDEIFLTPSAWISHVKHMHATDSREPSEFYLETNVTSSKQFGDGNYNLVPANPDIANGTTYTLVRDKLDEILTEKRDSALRESLVTSEMDEVRQIDETDEIEIVDVKPESVSNSTSEVVTITDRCRTRDKVQNKNRHDFVCRVCDAKCHDNMELAGHIMLWADEGPHLCEVCGRRFTNSRFYQEHRIKHSRRDPPEGNYCAVCREAFESSYFMKIHMAHLHTGKENDARRLMRLLNLRTTTVDVPGAPSTEIIESTAQSTISDNIESSASDPLEIVPEIETTSDDTVDIVYENIPDLSLGKAIAKPITYSYQCLKCLEIFSCLKLLREHHRRKHPSIGHQLRLENANGKTIQEYLQKKLQQNAKLSSSSSRDDSLDIVYDKMADEGKPRGKVGRPKRFYTYKCPDCPQKEKSLEKLWIHHKTFHTSSRFGPNNAEAEDSVRKENEKTDKAVDDSPINSTEFVRIAAKRKLNEMENFEAIMKENASGLKRYRIYNGQHVVPMTPRSLKIDTPKNLEGIDKVKTTETFKCNICDCPMDSEDSLKAHKMRIHGVMPKYPGINNETREEPITSTMGKNMMKVVLNNQTQQLGKNSVLPAGVQRTIASLLSAQQSKSQPPKKVSITIVQASSSAISPESANLVNFKCSLCDQKFSNVGLLRDHNAKVHFTLPTNAQISDLDAVENRNERISNPNSIKELNRLVDKLPILTEKSKDSRMVEKSPSRFDFEPVMITIDENSIDENLIDENSRRNDIEITTSSGMKRVERPAVNNVTLNSLLAKNNARKIDEIIGNVRRRISDSELYVSQESEEKIKRRKSNCHDGS